MTTIYQLEIAAPASPADHVARVVRDAATATRAAEDVDPADLLHGNVTLPSGLWLYVAPLDEEDIDEPDQIATDFGVHRTVSVGLQLNGAEDPEPQMRDMLTVVFGVLDRLPGDALLHLEYEEAWLLRRSGRLVVNAADDVWHPDLLALVPQPYERATLQFSDVLPAGGASA